MRSIADLDRVQTFNTEALIMTFLPYHATKPFLNLLSILPKQPITDVQFLHPYINTLTKVPRADIVNAAIRERSLTTALSGWVLKTAKLGYHYHLQLAFWVSVFAQGIHGRLDQSLSGREERQAQLHEEILLQVLPIIDAALAIKQVPELTLGAYMLITILVRKASLNDAVLDALMVEIARSCSMDTQRQGIECLALLAEHKASDAVSPGVVKAVLRLPDVRLSLPLMMRRYSGTDLFPGRSSSALSWLPQNSDQQLLEDVVADGDNAMDLDQPALADIENTEDIFAAVPENVADDPDLSSTESPLYATLLPAFEAAVKRSSVGKFEQLPLFSAPEPGPTRLLRFLTRTCCTCRNAASRKSALNVLAERTNIQQLHVAQLVAPYMLICLSDTASSVRQEASPMAILHSASSTLSARDLKRFLEVCLLPHLEEFVADSRTIGRVLGHSLGRGSDAVNGDDGEAKKLKTAQKEAVYQLLCNNVRDEQVPQIKIRFLELANQVDKVAGQPRSRYLAESLQLWFRNDYGRMDVKDQSVRSKLHAAFLQSIVTSDSDAVSLLLSAMGDNPNALPQPDGELLAMSFSRLAVMWPSLKASRQKSIVEVMIRKSTSISSGSETIKQEATNFLRAAETSSEVLLSILDPIMDDVRNLAIPTSSKKRRISNGEAVRVTTESSEFSVALAKLSLVLELMDGAKPLDKNVYDNLFKALAVLEILKKYKGMDLSYLQSTTLQALSSTVTAIEQLPKPDLICSVDQAGLLVSAVEHTTNPEVRTAALLLLSRLAKHAPQSVLDSIMPVFTLMSSTIMGQSDDFSAHVVDQVIRVVVPLLAESLRKRNADLVSAASEIIVSFAAAFDHIPTQRRLRLYTLLASALSASETLYAIVVTLVDRYPKSVEVQRFVANLVSEFSGLEILSTLKAYTVFVNDLCKTGSKVGKTLLGRGSDGPVDLSTASHFIAIVPAILKSRALQTKVLAILSAKNGSAIASRTFGDIVRVTIDLNREACRQNTSVKSCSEALEILLGLLPINSYIDTVDPLLDDADPNLRNSIMSTILNRVRQNPRTDKQSSTAIVAYLSRIGTIITSDAPSTLLTTAVACINEITEKYGRSDTSAVAAVAATVCTEKCLASENKLLRTVSLHFLATAIGILGDGFIPLLKRTLLFIDDNIDESVVDGKIDTKLHNAAFAALSAIVEQLSFMLTSTMLAAILEACHVSAAVDIPMKELQDDRNDLFKLMGRQVPLKNIAEAATSSWTSAVNAGVTSTQEQLQLVVLTLRSTTKGKVVAASKQLFEFFDLGLELRSDFDDDTDEPDVAPEQIDRVEGAYINTFMEIVLKLSDAVFRPYFVRLAEKCTSAKTISRTSLLRCVTFYALLTALSSNLKAIVTTYFSYCYEHMASLLNTSFGKDAVGSQVQRSVLEAAASSFRFDQDDFWQAPTHFDIILPALTASLSRPATSSNAVTALTELANAVAASTDNLKTMNQALLKLLKADSVRTRTAAVKAQQSLTQKLGEDWLALLPEMLPVVAEILDDDDEGVCREAREWVSMMEGIMGESLEGMLQ
ncbi:hypothetical protein MRB53_040959 [Persea americana]|nr:hypothetical protein MRB53_040959 [Persea americana]